MAGVPGGVLRRSPRGGSLRHGVAKPAYHEQCVVDAQAEPQHRDHALEQNGQRPDAGRDRRRTERDGYGQCPGADRHGRGHRRSERQQQQDRGDRQGTPLGALDVDGAGMAQVHVQRCLAGPPEGDVRVV